MNFTEQVKHQFNKTVIFQVRFETEMKGMMG